MGTTTASPTDISPQTVAERAPDDLFVLDVRNEEDYEEWSIEGSYNLPVYDQLLRGDASGLVAALDELPEDEPMAVVCVAGVTSARAAQFLRGRGFDARSMTGGMGGWGRVHRRFDVEDAPGVTQIIRPGTGCVSYLVHDEDEAVVVDPSLYVGEYLEAAEDLGVDIVGAIDTHAHADHVSGGRPLANALDVPYYLHGADSGELDDFTPLSDGETMAVGSRELEVVHTPGHTHGSISLSFGDVLLSGDTLFVRSVGRPDLEGADEEEVEAAASNLHGSLERLTDFPDDVLVLPGHMSDEEARPLATTLDVLEQTNDLVGLSDREEFVSSIVESLGTTPSNYQQIKQINWGLAPLTEQAKQLELGPNNCAAS